MKNKTNKQPEKNNRLGKQPSEQVMGPRSQQVAVLDLLELGDTAEINFPKQTLAFSLKE